MSLHSAKDRSECSGLPRTMGNPSRPFYMGILSQSQEFQRMSQVSSMICRYSI